MLMLDSDQVRYCQVTGYVDNQQRTVSGLVYNGNVFTLAKSFAKDELEQAIKECREDYLDCKERSQIPTLLVKDRTNVGIWMQDNRFQFTQTEAAISQESQPQAAANLDRISIRQIGLEMRSPDGVAIKTRRFKLKLYQRCFLGSEAVDWIVKKYGVSRADAALLGQKLIEKKIAHHVSDEHQFEDADLLYRFYEDEGKSIWTDKLV